MMDRLIILLLTAGIAISGEASPPTCMSARNKCTTRIGCGMALHNFEIACSEVRLGAVNHCTPICMKAVIALVTVADDIGTNYLTCDCDGNEDCSLWRSRISLCTEDVLKALGSLDDEDTVSCSLARMLCEADTRCWTALNYYEDYCQNLWIKHSSDGLECSDKCNNSLSVLYRQSRADKLKNCLCDKTDPLIDEDTCIRMKYNTKTYCLDQEPDNMFKEEDEKSYNLAMKVDIANSAPIKSVGSRTLLSFLYLTLTLIYPIINLSNLCR